MSVPNASPTSKAKQSVATLAWMTGCWVEDLGPVQVEDEWTAPTGHRMLGVSRTRQGDSTIALELRAMQDSAGSVILTSMTTRAQETLRSDRFTSSIAEFVTPVHTGRIVVRYDRDSSDQLVIHRERPVGIRRDALDEIFNRTPCRR